MAIFFLNHYFQEIIIVTFTKDNIGVFLNVLCAIHILILTKSRS